MKKIIAICLLSLLFQSSQAQYYYLPFTPAGQNPGNLNNEPETTYSGATFSGWDSILGPNNASAVWSSTQTLPFNFTFNGQAYNQYLVSSSGILTFDILTALPAPGYTRAALPDAAIPDNSICIWGLNSKGFNDEVYTKTFGNSPNRQVWIQFNSFGYGNTISDASNSAFWAIVLEETSNNIYLVDMRTVGFTGAKLVSAGIQLDNSTAISVVGSPNLAALAGGGNATSDNSFYQFTEGIQPNFDLTVTKINTPLFSLPGNVSITGELRNLGADTITSLKINYQINGGTVTSSVLSGLFIEPLNSQLFTHSIPWNAASPGTYTITCFATDINGANADQHPQNDSLSKTVHVLLSQTQRKPLFEIFTSSTCPPCQPGNLNFHSIVDTIPQDNFVSIKYQEDFPGSGDPYATAESINRRLTYYGINSIPRMENDGGWDGNANSFTYPLYKTTRAVPAQYELWGRFSADTISKTYSAKIYYKALFETQGTVLQTAIVEKKTTANVASNGETAFYNVLKKMLPDEQGSILPPTTAGAIDSASITYSFNGNYRLPLNGQSSNIINHAIEHSVEQFSDLTMLCWVQSGNNKQVYQAANLLKDSYIGIYPMSKNITEIRLFPNPAVDFVSIEINLNAAEKLHCKLLDESNRMVQSQEINGTAGKCQLKFDLSNKPAGIYFVQVSDSKQNAFIRRIVKEAK